MTDDAHDPAHDPAAAPPVAERDALAALTALARRRPVLDLGAVDLLFLAALYLRGARSALSNFDEPQLYDVFEEVSALADAPPEGRSRARATHAIRRLREQHTLARVDHAGVLRRGEYSLTRLGAAVAEFFLEDDALTRENLPLLTTTLLASLESVERAAHQATTEGEWEGTVTAPLRVTVADLVAGIQRRQRGFDVQQEELRHEVGELLKADWFGAVERCEALLESTGKTLRELGDVLMRDTHTAQARLQDIQDIATTAGSAPAEAAARAVMDQIDRVASWGSARQRGFSEYYQYVHRFLRDVVRLDPTRAVTQRLRDQLAGRLGRSFSLLVAIEAPPTLLREGTYVPDPGPPARRPKKPREAALEEREPPPDPREVLTDKVSAALAGGARSLAEVVRVTTRDVEVGARFVEAGRVAETVGRLARPLARAERPWVPTDDGYELEEWPLMRERDRAVGER